nr:hypothetical protein [Tanacetum cinerariifolium]
MKSRIREWKRKKLETLKEEKQGVDGKLAGLLKASKDLDNLIESQRSDKIKDGLGYSAVPPPPSQLYLSLKKDLTWTGLPECADDTVTDYSRPSPTVESTLGDDQNRNPFVSKTVASPTTPKPFIKFVKLKDSQSKSKTGKTESLKKPLVKIRVKKSFTPKPIVYIPYRPSQRPVRTNMNGNISYLSDYEPFDGGYVSFGQGGCKITRKGTIKTSKLKFENFYFMKDLKYNLFSVSQICDNKNGVLFTDSECIVLGRVFKLLDDANILLRTLRQHNMYSIDLNNIVPHRDLTCLVAKASADKRNRTLIETAKTMLADAKLPVTFWTEAVNTACYVQNRVLVNKSHNKTPYELFNGRSPTIGFLKPFGCHVMILNTLDNLGKFEKKGDEGYFIGYSMSSKAFRVFNKRTKRVEENLHVEFLENKAIEKGTKDAASQEMKKNVSSIRYIALPNWAHDALLKFSLMETPIPTVSSLVLTAYSTDSQEPSSDARLISKRVANQEETPSLDNILSLTNCFEDILGVSSNSKESNGVEADISNMETAITASPTRTLRIHKDHPKRARPIGTKWVLKNKKDKREIVIRIKARLVAQGHTQEEGIDYDESAFLYGTIDEEVYVMLPPGFQDSKFPAKVYKVEKAIYGLHQAPRAWYGTLSKYLLKNGFQRGIIDQTLFIRRQRGDFILVQVYMDDIIFGSSNPQLCREFEALMHENF